MTMSDGKSRSRVIGAALLLLAFVVGGAVGAAVDRMLMPRSMIRITRDMSGVLDKLELTPKQRAQADAIIQRSAPLTQNVMLETAERLRVVSDSINEELRAVLTPPQRARLDSLRGEPVFMLKRKMPGSGTTVDTVRPQRQDSTRRPPPPLLPR